MSDTKDWMAEIQRRDEEYRRLTADLTKVNKVVLIAALQGTQVAKITATYSGMGDDGEFDYISGFDSQSREMPLPSAILPIKSARYDDQKKVHSIETNDLAFDEAVKDLCYSLLQAEHPGWEINEGSDGQFSLTLNPGAPDGMHIELEHNQRVESVEPTIQEW